MSSVFLELCRCLLFGRSKTGRIGYGGLRALGYPNSYEFHKALDANGPDFRERVRLAKTKLLEKFGVSLGHEWGEIVDAFKRMEAGLPEQYQAYCR